MRSPISTATVFVFLAVMGILGCGSGEVAERNSVGAGSPHGHSYTGDYVHRGPHDGHVIELGHDHKYHAELVENNNSERLAVYILDRDLNEISIGQKSIVLILSAGGGATSYKLDAVDHARSPAVSRFDSTDKALFHTWEQYADLTGKLRVTIEGVPYVGHVAHHSHTGDDSTHWH